MVDPEPVNAPASLPIYQAAGWVFRDLDEVDAVYEARARGVVYGGSGSPNHWALEAALCRLHGAEAALVTAAGMSAFTALLLSAGRSGTCVAAADGLYGNTTHLLRDFEKFGIVVRLVDPAQPEAARTALAQPGDILIIETISNPRIQVADVARLASVAHDRGALVVVDNSLASPYHCKPLDLGADAVIESITKFMGGHHDLVLGCLLGSSALIEAARTVARRAGLSGPAFETWLATRSLPELELRLTRSSASALAIAQWLEQQPPIRAVRYPGLPSSANHETARRTLRNGFGSVLSFELAPERAAVNNFVRALERVRLVLSFGGTETTVSHPGTSSHRALSADERQRLGVHDGFMRLSVGIEETADIISDLARGLNAL
ncbi:MAG: aminotransferase class I/II-fold pyridoxal phosphate-dependent enzyme [Candidatus Eremiobacteraeota bacterium]|nr:aminotransferase class I/II-fold pyridoxal phosphate-dependent enzyme [Candidatus Eremiobacteraeota bacterium]